MAKISAKLASYLDKSGYNYEIVEHKTTYTAWDTAQTEKIKPSQVAKCLVMKADKGIFVAVLPAYRNVDSKKLLKVINDTRKKQFLKTYKKIDFAKEAWMKKNMPGKVGAVPPFAGFIKMDVYVDKLMLKSKKIILGSGEYTLSLAVRTGQYLKKEKPWVGNFSMKK